MPFSLDRTSVPKLAPGCDVTRLPIGAREGFVLSRVDGTTSIGEIAALTGFPVDEVERILGRLVELRAAFFGDVPPWTPLPPPVEPKPEPAKRASPPPEPVRRPRSRRFRLEELDEPAELDRALKERILDTYTWLDELDHYELLGVPREADRKTIKNAYYALAATFHTDRYFGKQLGSFKSKMEQIFGRITQAHDTLSNARRRSEYDAYLLDRRRTKAFERYLAGEDPFEDDELAPEASAERDSFPTPAPVEEVPTPVPAAEEIPSPVPTEGTPSPSSVEEIPTPATVGGAAGRTADDRRARRETLARRLAGASSGRLRSAQVASPQRSSRSSASEPISAEEARAATEAIRRRYAESRAHVRQAQSKRLLAAADEALRSDDLVSAANHLRQAVRISDDPAIAARYEDVSRRAREEMAETYLNQARYEETQGDWPAAALSYLKAHEGRPDDAEICERAANALRMEGRDLHKAARFAELAVQKNPSSAAFRVTLGAVYLDAGLFLRARSELEQAAKLDSGDATIKDLLARARKMAS